MSIAESVASIASGNMGNLRKSARAYTNLIKLETANNDEIHAQAEHHRRIICKAYDVVQGRVYQQIRRHVKEFSVASREGRQSQANEAINSIRDAISYGMDHQVMKNIESTLSEFGIYPDLSHRKLIFMGTGL